MQRSKGRHVLTVTERLALAQSLESPPVRLRELSKDRSVAMRAAVAANAKTPQDVLAQLARDKTDLAIISI